MSLIVAKIIEGKIQIESDTKISGENAVRNNPIKGRLKSLILARNLVLCYAGDVGLGERAYNYFLEKVKIQITLQDFLFFLKDLTDTNVVDFILAGYNSSPYLYKISNNIIEQVQNAWIGDYNAFKQFQEIYLDDSVINKNSDWFTSCFNKVVESQLNETVGEFHVTVKTNLEEFVLDNKIVPVFQYILKSSLTLGRPKTTIIEEVNVPQPIPSGNEQDGTYSISYFTNLTQERAALGIYFEYGSFGILYRPDYLLNEIIYKTCDAQEFINSVYSDTRIELKGMQALKDTIGFRFIGPK